MKSPNGWQSPNSTSRPDKTGSIPFAWLDLSSWQAVHSADSFGCKANPHVQFRSGPHTLIARTIEGNYPNYRQVIPHEFVADATIPETHRATVISWLKSLDGRSPTVRLTWETPGQLTLTHWDSGTAQATIRVPVSTSGGRERECQPPAISFAPRYLAEALAIGPVLRLIDGISPGVATGPSGNFCVIMPCRCVVEDAKDAGDKAAGSAAATPAMAA